MFNIRVLPLGQYIGRIASALWGVASVEWRLFSTVGVLTSVHEGDNISTVGDNISIVKNIQYCRGIPSVLWGITAVHVGDSFIIARGYLQYCGGCSVQWGITSVQ